MNSRLPLLLIVIISITLAAAVKPDQDSSFYLVLDDDEGVIFVFNGDHGHVLTQNAKVDMRPYLHPIIAPGTIGELTQYSPGHHKHQTGLYWGFTRVNGSGAPADTLRKWFYNPNKPQHIRDQIGRDFFHNNGGSHWKRVALETVTEKGEQVAWKTVYHMLDASGQPILEETMHWTLSASNEKLLIDLEWHGKAIEAVTINAFEYGGMFLRMPWKRGIAGEAINNLGQSNGEAEGQNAKWVDVGMEIKGMDAWGHIAMFDHPQNPGYPTQWRVDGQLGVGPCYALAGDWHIKKGETEIFKHRLVAYAGNLDSEAMNGLWDMYAED